MSITLEEYREKFNEEDTVGWDAIDSKLKEIYPEQEPRKYGPTLPLLLGGNDPVESTYIYDSEKQEFHRHFISFGMSELYYKEETVGDKFSKWGFEFTFRLKPFEEDNVDDDPFWVIQVMNNLARYVNESGRWFEEYQFVPIYKPIRSNTIESIDIVGLIFVPDPELGKIETPNGEVTFLQMVGVTSSEIGWLLNNSRTNDVRILADKLRKDNPLLITDLLRK